VDDEETLLRVSRAALTRAGFRVLSADSGPRALAICREHVGPIHLAVVDIVMPDMSGPELRDCLRAEFSGVRVLFVSGFAPEVILSRGIDLGSAGFLAKPFTSAQLVARVRAEVEKPGAAQADSL
jgi:DNA-binding response OmpR family regulator